MVAAERPWTIVVGAGPSGLLLALLLAKKGVSVHVLEGAAELDDSPRAAYYGPPAAHALQTAGVLDEIRVGGFDPVRMCWRKLDGTYLAGMDNSLMNDDPLRLACMPLAQLDRLLYREAIKEPHVKVFFNHRVVQVGQDAETAWVDVDTPEGQKRLHAYYIVGCDGASSTVRRKLFPGKEFPGYTWDKQIVATNVSYPFEKYGYDDSNFFIHPEHWHMVARLTKNADGSGLWRCSYGELGGFTREELIARQPMKFKAMFPGSPDEGQYDLVAISPYKIHQRLVESMRVGRFMLAADAAHICNPFGGLGLTGGLVDIEGLYECLLGIYQGKADDSILDKYSEIRRQKYKEIVDPVSTDNIKRLYDQDPEKVMENDPLMKALNDIKDDEKAQVEFMRSPLALMYDFTQHYHKEHKPTNGTNASEKSSAIGSHVEQIPEQIAVVGPE